MSDLLSRGEEETRDEASVATAGGPLIGSRLAVVTSLVALSRAALAQSCALDAPPTVLESSGSPHDSGARLAQLWEVDASPVFWTTQRPTAGSYSEFARALRASGVDTNPVSLLQRKAALPQTLAGDARNDSLVAREGVQ